MTEGPTDGLHQFIYPLCKNINETQCERRAELLNNKHFEQARKFTLDWRLAAAAELGAAIGIVVFAQIAAAAD